MSIKKTIAWLMVAGGLFAFIYFYQRHAHPPSSVPSKVLPELNPEAVTSLSIRPSGPVQLQIRVDRTNGSWQLTQPLVYPAQSVKVRKLLGFLAQLRPAPYLSGSELRNHANADEEFGFAAPQATLGIQQGAYAPRLRVGALTNPGDQVFVQVEGDLGAYVVDAELLKYLPHSADDWRDTVLVDLEDTAFDRVGVTNNAKADANRPGLPASTSTFVLQRGVTNRLWRMVWPLDARANDARIESALQKLQELRVRKFVSDDPKADLEPLGLAPAELELGLAKGSNSLELIQFGRCPSNDVSTIYARRVGRPGIVTVSKDSLLSWCAVLNEFRDPHLLKLPADLGSVEFQIDTNQSSLQRQPDGSWKLSPEDFTADPNLISGLFSTLTNIEITRFVNDVATPADLPQYGLAAPALRLVLKQTPASAGGKTNAASMELDFGYGTNAADKVYARRTDESSVYAVSTNDFARLPVASWQLRDRTLCRFTVADVAGLSFRQQGKVCQMIHKGPLSWVFAPGSQGIINEAAIEETVRGVVQTSAITWVARGAQSRAAFGLTADATRLILELKTGGSFELEFGGEAPSGNIYACVTLEGQPWIMEFPWLIFRDISSYFPLSPQK